MPVRGSIKTSGFSSLSESGFIPTGIKFATKEVVPLQVLISFREWLHSYPEDTLFVAQITGGSSHLFQRVASFLRSRFDLINKVEYFSSHLFQRVASFLRSRFDLINKVEYFSSHLFQRVASFLPRGTSRI